ncbi:MAG: hypothetical protein ACM32E_26760 [Gemmatimonadota bacterium]
MTEPAMCGAPARSSPARLPWPVSITAAAPAGPAGGQRVHHPEHAAADDHHSLHSASRRTVNGQAATPR